MEFSFLLPSWTSRIPTVSTHTFIGLQHIVGVFIFCKLITRNSGETGRSHGEIDSWKMAGTHNFSAAVKEVRCESLTPAEPERKHISLLMEVQPQPQLAVG